MENERDRMMFRMMLDNNDIDNNYVNYNSTSDDEFKESLDQYHEEEEIGGE